MTYIGAMVRAASGLGYVTLEATASMLSGDWMVATVTLKKLRSPSPDVAATLDDLIPPEGWVRLAARSLTASGDPTVLLDVAAIYAAKATAAGGSSTGRFTWSFNETDAACADGAGAVIRSTLGVSSIDGPGLRGRSDSSITLPSASGKAGTGHVLRIMTPRVEQFSGFSNENVLTYSGLPAGETARVAQLSNMHVVNEQPKYWLGVAIIEAAVTSAAPAAETFTPSVQSGTAVRTDQGWTVFLSDKAAPLPPAPVDPTDGQWVDWDGGYRLRLQHNTLGTVGALTGIAVWRSTDGGTTKSWWKASSSTWEATEQVNATSDPWVDFPAAAWANAGTNYLVGLATTGAGSTEVSNYTQLTVIGSDRPTADLSVVGLASGEVADVTPQVDVTGTPAAGAGVTGWQVRLFDLLTSGRNLAPNASFESGIDGWAGKASGYTPGACSWSPLFPTHGEHSLRVQWAGGGIGAAGADFPVEAGKAYTWSAYIRVPSGSPDVRASWLYKSTGTPTSVKDASVRVTHTFVADVTGTIPLGFETTNGLPGYAYVDRIQLVEGLDAGEWVYSDPDAGTPTVDSGILPGLPGSFTVPRELALTPHNPYRVYARVRQTGGQWSTWDFVDIEPNVDTPDAPTVTITVTTHPVSGAPGLSVVAVMPAWTGGQLRARVQRSVGGAWQDLGTDLLAPDGTTHLDDWTAPSMVPCAYRVRAETTDLDGAPLVGGWSDLAIGVLTDVGGWLVDPARPETGVAVEVTAFGSRSIDTQAATVVPLASDPARPVAPVVVSSVPVTDAGQMTVRGLSTAHVDAVRALLTSGALLMVRWWPVRDARGGSEPGRDLLFRVVGQITPDLIYQGPTSAENLTFSWVGQYPTSGADTESSWTVVDAGVRS